MFWYCITAQCLTPLVELNQLNPEAGIYATAIRADSLQDAIKRVMNEISEPYKTSKDLTAIKNFGKMTVAIMDSNAHIVNYYWGFRGHRI